MLFLNTSLSLTSFKLSRYKPYINYDWSTTTTSGLRYLKDVGSTPTYNASMYFGRGAYFNGVDQSIEYDAISSSDSVAYSFCGKQTFTSNRYNLWTTNIGISYYLVLNTEYKNISYAFNSNYNYVLNLTKNSIKLYENGLLVINITTTDILYGSSKTIGRRGSSYYGASYLKDFYIFDRNLTEIEITQAYEQPELFYAMAQADSTCVLNMPMCETDGYVRNMKSYGEGSELDTSFVAYNYISSNLLRISQFNLGLVIEANKTYLVEIGYDDTANSILTGYVCYGENGNGTHANFHTALKGIVNGTKGTAFYLLQIPSTYLRLSSTTAYAWISTTAADKTAYISVRSLKEVTGVYPITNYTSSVRDNAKNLQYGLQTCKFVRDSLGVIQSASDYLECDKVGYADTGWMPSVGKDWSIELICQSNGVIDFGVQSTGWLIVSQSQGKKYFIYLKNSIINTVNSYLYGSSVCLSLVYTEKLKTLTLYENSIYVNSSTMDTSIYPLTVNFLLGKRNGGGQLSEGILRLFKVHNKVLTQAEITANYNSYVAKGLLS